MIIRLCLRGLPLMALAVVVSGCGGDSTDKRLHGDWEGRRGFSKTIQVDFNSNGTTKIVTKGSSQETVSGYWSVVKRGKRQITIQMKRGMTGSYQERRVKFINEDYIELTSASGSKTRLRRIR